MSKPNKPIVLVLCTGNSARSQTAEGFLRRDAGDRYDVRSAGTSPAPAVHPLAVRVTAEVGVDIAGQRPKPLDQYLGKLPVRHLLIVCDRAGGTCPRIWPGTFTRDYMPFDDPAAVEGTDAERAAAFRRGRDEIAEAMRTWPPGVARPAPALTRGA